MAQCVRFRVLAHLPGPPCPLSAHLYRMTARSPLAPPEVSYNQWRHTMTTMEDYKDSLSLCLLACCTHFGIPLIGFYFCAIKRCGFLYSFLTFSVSTVEIVFYACCFFKGSDFITTSSSLLQVFVSPQNIY